MIIYNISEDLIPAQYYWIRSLRCFEDEFGQRCWPYDIPTGVLKLFFMRKTYLCYMKTPEEMIELFYEYD